MDKNTIVKVTNRNTSRVGYKIPELGVRRQFAPKETKELTFGEIEALSFIKGGLPLLKEYLIIRDEKALDLLGLSVEPEYFYSEEDIIKLLTTGSLDELLDCLDFAPEGVLDSVKKLSVSLPLNDVAKRDAILKKLNFNVTRAIEIQNTKYDGETESTDEEQKKPVRRATKTETETGATRRAAAPSNSKYKVIEK